MANLPIAVAAAADQELAEVKAMILSLVQAVQGNPSQSQDSLQNFATLGMTVRMMFPDIDPALVATAAITLLIETAVTR